MEHVEDDKAFIEEIYRVLKIGGLLLITVPLRIRKPFTGNDEPLIPATEQYPGHYREYSNKRFQKLLTHRFVLNEIYGVNRGNYVPLENARNAIVGIFRKRGNNA